MIVRNCLEKRILLSLCVFAAASLIAPKSHADLQRYVDKPEPAFEWQVKNKIGREQTGDRIYDLQFVSQTWRGEKWRHQLQVYQPADATPGAKMFLWVTGGSASAQTNALGLELARKIKAPVAFVYHIPNQPLLEGNLREDDLIAETFVRYLKSEDDNWPLLLPMVKSVVKAMDVLQAFSKKEWGAPVDQFIVAGASKRGWTTWLTAAVDPRVCAIAPVVIDVLNMVTQGKIGNRAERFASSDKGVLLLRKVILEAMDTVRRGRLPKGIVPKEKAASVFTINGLRTRLPKAEISKFLPREHH